MVSNCAIRDIINIYTSQMIHAIKRQESEGLIKSESSF